MFTAWSSSRDLYGCAVGGDSYVGAVSVVLVLLVFMILKSNLSNQEKLSPLVEMRNTIGHIGEIEPIVKGVNCESSIIGESQGGRVTAIIDSSDILGAGPVVIGIVVVIRIRFALNC